MAISTIGTYLFYDNAGTYEKLVDIISYPDMGSAPSKIDTTDLSALVMKTNILGLQEAPDITFEANYDATVYDTIKALEGTLQSLQLQFGTDGVDGLFDWDGYVSVFATGAGVDESRKMTVVVSVTTEIAKS